MACLSPRTTALLKLSVPHVALVIFYFSYLFAGSLLFHFLENTSEKKAVAQFDNREESLREEIKTLLMNCSEAAPEQATLLDTLLQELVDTVTHPDWEGGRYDVMESGNEWSISSSLLFCFTTITTIGYGVSVPATTMGKIAVVIYSAIGVPLSFLLFADMGGLLARLASFIASSIRLRCRGKMARAGFMSFGDTESSDSTAVHQDSHAVYRDTAGDNNAVEGGNDDGIFDGSTTSPVNKRESRIILQKQPSYLASVLEEYDNGNVPFPVIILFIGEEVRAVIKPQSCRNFVRGFPKMEGAQTKSNGPLMQGFLSRRIMGGSMKSKKKWFVLTGRRLLSFKSEQAFKNDNVFIDCFDLMQLQAVRALTSQGHAKNAFEIVTMNKSIVFQSPSQEQSLQWLDALKEVMMQRFSDTAELPEKEEETKKIEDELQRRKSNLKFWRNSSQSSSRHFSDEEDAINSFDFLANQEKQEEEEGDVFNDGDHDQDLADHMVDARPISASSGVDSTSVDESPDYDVPATHAHSEDEGISETTGEPNSDETNDPMYENFRQPEKLRRKSSPAIEELKELVHFEEKVNDDDTGTAEVKGIEELRALLASMP